MISPDEFSTVGLTLCTVGAIFLSRSILIKRTRRVVEEFFGINSSSLSQIRHYIDAKHHVFSGCGFLIVGFGIQLVGLLLIGPSNEAVSAERLMVEGFVVLVIGALCWMGTNLMSRNSLQRYLRDFFQRNYWPFEENIELSKEIGDVFGIPYNPEDSIEAYLYKLRTTVGVPENLHRAKASDRRRGERRGNTPYF